MEQMWTRAIADYVHGSRSTHVHHHDYYYCCYSMLMRINPSFVSTIPRYPTRPLAPLMGRPALDVFPLFPAELPFSLGGPETLSPPWLLPGREPHGILSRCNGLCMMGELCALMPGLTARLLNMLGSKSSSLLRLLLIRRVISAAVGGMPPAPCAGVAKEVGCGVSDFWLSLP